MSALPATDTAGTTRACKGRRAELLGRLAAHLLPFVQRVIGPELHKLLLTQPPVDPADARVIARLAGSMAAQHGGSPAEVRRAMREVLILANCGKRPRWMEEAVRLMAAEAAVEMAEAWIGILKIAVRAGPSPATIDCRELDGSMLPRRFLTPADGIPTEFLFRREPMDETVARGILWDVRSALPPGRVLPDCAADLLAFDGYVVAHY